MVGRECLSIRNYLQTYSNESVNNSFKEFRNFPTIQQFYDLSRITDLDGFYESCLMMTIETSNNQEIINRMPFNKYLRLQKALSKYIEAKNKAESGQVNNEQMNNQMESFRQQSASMMSQMKSNFKIPKFK